MGRKQNIIEKHTEYRKIGICLNFCLTALGFLFVTQCIAQGKIGKYQTMTMDQAMARIPERPLPEFWFGSMEKVLQYFDGINAGKVELIAKSPGKRPIHLISYGKQEELAKKANFNSAVAGRMPSAFMDKDARLRPVILFVGPVHGHEVEGLTGLMNLIHIMETGEDLRGRNQRELQILGERCRLLIIPAGNPDGTARLAPGALQGMKIDDIQFWGQGTWSDDSFCGWPDSKRQHPMTGANVGFLGCYFNDMGINPMHEEFLNPMSTEAPAILSVAQTEGPDLAVSLHSHANIPMILRPAYVPLEVQENILNLAREYDQTLEKYDLPGGRLFEPRAENQKRPSSFNLIGALYHISGAHSFTHECPHGVSDGRAGLVSFDDMLDMQLALYETMMRFELTNKSKHGNLDESGTFRADFNGSSPDPDRAWHFEGGGTIRIQDGRVAITDTSGGAVLWTKRSFPSGLRLQFDLSFSNNRGIGVIFLGAKGTLGENILLDLPERSGIYAQYTKGRIKCYGLSLHRYFPDGRKNAGINIRKNPGFHIVSHVDPDPVPKAGKTYQIMIEKNRGHLRLRVDGTLIHDWIDTGIHGDVLTDGRIGFRVRGHSSCEMYLDNIIIGAFDE